MDVQLQRGKTNHYCFVSDCAAIGRGYRANARGSIAFTLEFARWEAEPGADGKNVPEGVKTMTATELGAWWAANPEWRVVDV